MLYVNQYNRNRSSNYIFLFLQNDETKIVSFILMILDTQSLVETETPFVSQKNAKWK